MHRDDETSDAKAASEENSRREVQIERSWGQRLEGPIQYRRFSGVDWDGEKSIFFKFDSPLEGEVAERVNTIQREMSSIFDKRREQYQQTGMRVLNDPKLGKLWRLRNDKPGRVAADVIDGKLTTLARELEEKQGRGC
jgi:hypothetical protein